MPLSVSDDTKSDDTMSDDSKSDATNPTLIISNNTKKKRLDQSIRIRYQIWI